MGGRPWLTEELEILDTLANKYPGPYLVRRYQRKAKALGLPCRTHKSILGKVGKEYGTTKTLLTNYNARDIAAMLELSPSVIYHWIKKNWLMVTRHGSQYWVTPYAMKKLAERRPDLLRRCDLDGLKFLLGDAMAIACKNADYPPRAPRAVVCTNTGRHYNTIAEAAKKTFHSEAAIRYHLKQSTGKWVYAEDYQRGAA